MRQRCDSQLERVVVFNVHYACWVDYKLCFHVISKRRAFEHKFCAAFSSKKRLRYVLVEYQHSACKNLCVPLGGHNRFDNKRFVFCFESDCLRHVLKRAENLLKLICNSLSRLEHRQLYRLPDVKPFCNLSTNRVVSLDSKQLCKLVEFASVHIQEIYRIQHIFCTLQCLF